MAGQAWLRWWCGLLCVLLAACRGVAPRSTPLAAPPQVAARDPGTATLQLVVKWPRRPAAIPQNAEHLVFRLLGAPGLPQVPTLDRPSGGQLGSFLSVQVPALPGLQAQCTALDQGGAVLAQSPLEPLALARNTVTSATLELLPAFGPDLDHAAFYQPEIVSVSPFRGYAGVTQVTVLGKHFGASQGSGILQVGGVPVLHSNAWSEDPQGAVSRIDVTVPSRALTGPLHLRLGPPTSPVGADYPAATGSLDPWDANFNILGAITNEATLDTGVIREQRTAWDGANFIVVWTRQQDGFMEMACQVLSPIRQVSTVDLTPGPTTVLATGSALLLGDVAADSNGAWISWQTTEGPASSVWLAHPPLSMLQSGSSRPVNLPAAVLSASPVIPANPVLAVANSGKVVAAWMDNIDTTNAGDGFLHQRVYARCLSSQGALLGSKMAVQDSNGPSLPPTSVAGSPSIATDGDGFLVTWQENSGTDAFGIGMQPLTVGNGGIQPKSGLNRSFSATRADIWNSRLAWAPSVGKYVLVYERRLATASTTRVGDIYVQALGADGSRVGQEVAVTDDFQTRGLVDCPSFDPSVPCGRGIRRIPQIAWNGRDLMLAWQFDRNYAGPFGTLVERDILGARMAFKPGTTTLDRADEEPTTGAAGQTTRSVAEILYTPDSGIQAFSEPGDQTAPRLCVGGDALLLTYQSKAGGPSGLCWRLWR